LSEISCRKRWLAGFRAGWQDQRRLKVSRACRDDLRACLSNQE
jgi:hypothetical protein